MVVHSTLAVCLFPQSLLMTKTRKQTAADRGRPNPIVPPPRGCGRGLTATLQVGRGLATAVQARSGQATRASPELPSTGGRRGRRRGRGAPSLSGSRAQEPGHDFGADDSTPPGSWRISNLNGPLAGGCTGRNTSSPTTYK